MERSPAGKPSSDVPNRGNSERMERMVRAARAASDLPGPDPLPSSPECDPKATSGLYVVGPAAAASALRLLLVFEDHELAVAVRRILRRELPMRAQFQIAREVSEADAAMRGTPYDVVVAGPARDPADDSIEALVASAAQHGDVPLIVLGAEREPAVAVEACRMGAQDYVVRGDTSDSALARAVLCAHARAERTRKLVGVAHVDDLTGVANRRPLQARFTELRYEALRRGGKIAMLMVDVDRFKQINDEHGHLVGDRVLAMMASRIVASTRRSDLVARLGGDEFAVLLGPVDERVIVDLVGRLEAALSQPIVDGDLEIPVSASVGYALGDAEETTELAVLARSADAEMYRRKRERFP